MHVAHANADGQPLCVRICIAVFVCSISLVSFYRCLVVKKLRKRARGVRIKQNNRPSQIAKFVRGVAGPEVAKTITRSDGHLPDWERVDPTRRDGTSTYYVLGNRSQRARRVHSTSTIIIITIIIIIIIIIII